MSTDLQLAARLARIAGELAAITEQLRLQHVGRTLEPGPKARKVLEVLREMLQAREGRPVPHMDLVWELHEKRGFGRSVAYEHCRKLEKRGLIVANAARDLTLPDAPKTVADLL